MMLVWLVLATAPATSVTPFRTEVTPRVDPVFGDVAALRRTVDRFLALHADMEQVRAEFSTAVHGTLALLAARAPGRAARCPPGALAQYTRAQIAGSRFLSLGRQLESRFREIRRADELGDAAGLTPDYRWKVKRARELYEALLRDYREMRVAFYEQLGAEIRHAGCKTNVGTPARSAGESPDPSDPGAWTIEEPATEASIEAAPRTPKPLGPTAVPAAAPAIWISVDNSGCAQPSQITLDGVALGTVPPGRKLPVRARTGPHELCVLPASDGRACGDPGTVRRAYMYEGWTVVVRCDEAPVRAP